ncbi:MAG TPA: RedB protein [Planctomycetota bacterium]|nr:RedB protein [Planctomycetota bacterium]
MLLLGGLGAFWLSGILWGMREQMIWGREAGAVGKPARSWPGGSLLTPPSTAPVLVLAAHPRCPCTRASLEELAMIQTAARGRLRCYVLFTRPEGCSDAWVRTSSWDLALAVPGVQPLIDPEGREAQRFGARTSGHAFLFAPDGSLVFSGGITRARGETGANPGASCIVDFVNGKAAAASKAAVFGCPLFD